MQPLDSLYDASTGTEMPLPSQLAEFYGTLRFPLRDDRPYVIGNLVTTLDGAVSLAVPGKSSGKEISGNNAQDRMLMGVLRGVADAVVVGAGTLRNGRGHALAAEFIYPEAAEAYKQLRLGKEPMPLSVVVTGSGKLDPNMPIFTDGAEVLIVTTNEGAARVREAGLESKAHIAEVAKEGSGEESIGAKEVMEAIAGVRRCSIVLVEGGPHLMGSFFGDRLIEEQFLTLSPQIAGRNESNKRLSLVEGRTFAPDDPLWGDLAVVKRGSSHLFLRYTF